MEDQYGMADLRHYAGGRPFFPALPQPPDHPAANPYYLRNFCPENYAGNIAPPPGVVNPAAGTTGGMIGAAGFGTEAGGAGRWPRQETLTLLEIRSRLDARFKEANQKGPLWDEVSRIMYDEYGYQRTGKKCREKFENLYKYYKKTKGGKAGRQDGKHYQFFRQLDTLYGDHTANNHHSSALASNQTNFPYFPYNFPNDPFPYNNANQESFASLVSISCSSDFDTIASSENDSTNLNFLNANDPTRVEKIEKKSLKAKIKDSIDFRMKKMIEKQEAWMERMTRTIDENEKEWILREERWRRQDTERVEREQRLWAGEKAQILARDAALMEAFGKLAGKDSRVSCQEEKTLVESQNKGLKVDWDGNKAAWDWLGDRFIKCGKKRMGSYQYHVGSAVEVQGPDRGVGMSHDNISFFSNIN